MPAPLLKSTEIQTTIRKPLSWPMLICHQNEWQVCYKAKGKLGALSRHGSTAGKASSFAK